MKSPPLPPFQPAVYEIADMAAVQACYAGTATPEQQRRAIDWIILRAANTDELDYRTDSRDHAFTSGRRFVGAQIRKILQLNKAIFK